MPVQFRTFRLYAVKDAFLVEDAFTAYAAFAGILDTLYDDVYASTGFTLTAVGTGYTHPWQQTGLPASYAVRYHKTDDPQGVLIGSDDHQWMVTTNADGEPEIYENDFLVQHLPIVCPAEADVIVAFRQIQMSDDETDIWVTLSLWMNGQWITGYTTRMGFLIEAPNFGFTAAAATAPVYTDIRIPELTDFSEYGTLDPGEVAASGLQRGIEGRYLRYFLRPTGQLRAWKVKAVPSRAAIAERADYGQVLSTDLRQLMSRVRMMGAYTWAEAFDTDLLVRYGDRFQEVNNPMLLTRAECYAEAVKTLIRGREAAFTASIQLPYLPLLEPEDRITTADGDWLISETELDLQSGTIDQILTVRSYEWGEPE